MKKRLITLITLCAFLACYNVFMDFNSNVTYSAEKPVISGGCSKVNITPQVPIPINWHAGKNIPYDGIHDEIFTRAMVFSDGESKAVILTVDVSSFSDDYIKEIKGEIEQETKIPQNHIMISSINTHSGPFYNQIGRDYSRASSKEIDDYSNRLRENMIKAVKEADGGLESVNVGTGIGECRLNINRRAPVPGGIWLGKNPDGPCDHDVGVLRLDDSDGNTKSVFVNWACQGAVMGPTNNYLSGDWPAATSLFIEKAFGNKIIVPVGIGASGDVNPLVGPHGTSFGISSQSSDTYGFTLGEEVLRITKEMKTLQCRGFVKASERVINLPGKLSFRDEKLKGLKISEIMKLKAGNFKKGPEVAVHLSVIRVGNIVFVGISGDVFTEIGVKLKKSSPFKNTFILTNCNGSCGYIPTDKAYEEGCYEAAASWIMPGAENIVVKNLLDMLDKL